MVQGKEYGKGQGGATQEAKGRKGRGQTTWSPRLVGNPVAAGVPARRAVIEAVAAEADINLSLARAAVFLAFALVLGGFALHAAVLGFGSGGGHGRTLARGGGQGKCRW